MRRPVGDEAYKGPRPRCIRPFGLSRVDGQTRTSGHQGLRLEAALSNELGASCVENGTKPGLLNGCNRRLAMPEHGKVSPSKIRHGSISNESLLRQGSFTFGFRQEATAYVQHASAAPS